MKFFVNLFVPIYIWFVLIVLVKEIFFFDIAFFPDSRISLSGLMVIFIYLRFFCMKVISDKLAKLNYILLPIFTIVSYLLFFFENSFGFEYVATQYGVSYSRFFYLTLFSACLALYTASHNFSKQFIKKLIFILPIYLTMLAFYVFIRNIALFRIVIQEDHLVEYIQFFLLIVCSWLSYKIARYWWPKEKILAVIFILTTFLCFFVAGEEISWAQRLLSVSTPPELAEVNIQEEMNIHNIGPVFAYIYRLYMIIGLVGSSSWIFLKTIKQKVSKRLRQILVNLVPDWYLSLYFLVAFFYNYDKVYLNHEKWELIEPLWEEPMELLLIIGITLFFLTQFFKLYPDKLGIIKSIKKN